MAEKTWLYQNLKDPVPVLINKVVEFGDFSVVYYRKVHNNELGPQIEEIIYHSPLVGSGKEFGLNEDEEFPEIKTKYCKCCGCVEK